MKVEAEADEKCIPNQIFFHEGSEEKEVDDSDDLDNVLDDVTPERKNQRNYWIRWKRGRRKSSC